MVSKEGVVLYKNPEGVALDGWLNIYKGQNFLGRDRTEKRFFRLVKYPTQLWYYSTDVTARPRGNVCLKDSEGEAAEVRHDGSKLMILAKEPFVLLCENADEAIMWELAVKACLLHEKTREEAEREKKKQREVLRLSQLMQQKLRREQENNQKGKSDHGVKAEPHAAEELALKMQAALEVKTEKDFGSA
mmetsp:Transcript_31468/g.60694  ORF Transcript_31468/g.60694 Transcript_31468/m.60694 type:complete len:189 (+) Transcript_31468:63-629(+)|eukprot:CAMPEP_0167795670 /NCGR_PEP_ID=MMETSP0111_2-20121227/14580_1 /TAXON_ID=91324 /ORGANISM="Lotharella globosa, Strain CCCM811" /LENGTH=188 /DNA_ID=CAMNT_0007689395 /DNA_START=51 /DNA_END=617 /DNA_ORIENTATION=-